jgi:predicted regulator of Ras-like GTPase activity (Roadblock/LC7/MglB family)
VADNGIGDYFIRDVDDDLLEEDDDLLGGPVVVPVVTPQAAAAPAVPVAAPAPAAAVAPAPAAAPAVAPAAPARPAASARELSREERLAAALNDLMANSPDVQASEVISLDGFTMASALPQGMQEDRVGAMSAAILALGERAAQELGRGHLSQVFIEGEGGYVLLMAAGQRAVLTCMAAPDAKLGLVLYDMKRYADEIGEIIR